MIINEYTVTKDLYLEWKKEERRSGIGRKISILWIVILGLLLIATVVYMISPYGGNPTLWLALESLLLIYSIFHLFVRPKTEASKMYKKMADQLGQDWKRQIVFENDAIYIKEGGSFEVNYPYREIVRVRGTENIITIETESKHIVHVYKDKFSEGDYARFKRFIESKVVNRCALI